MKYSVIPAVVVLQCIKRCFVKNLSGTALKFDCKFDGADIKIVCHPQDLFLVAMPCHISPATNSKMEYES